MNPQRNWDQMGQILEQRKPTTDYTKKSFLNQMIVKQVLFLFHLLNMKVLAANHRPAEMENLKSRASWDLENS